MKQLNTTLTYVLASISLVCCCFAGLGIFIALPTYIIANNKLKDAALNPQEYAPENIKAMENAKTFALVALVINGVAFAYSIYSLATTDWEIFMEEYQKALDEYSTEA